MKTGTTFTRVDVVGAQGTELVRIKNNGSVTGSHIGVLDEAHGWKGH